MKFILREDYVDEADTIEANTLLEAYEIAFDKLGYELEEAV